MFCMNQGICCVGKNTPLSSIMGNINPTTIQRGRPEEVYVDCRKAIEKGQKAPRGFILMSGCEVPAKAPPYNIWVMRKAVSDFGWY